MRKLLVSIKPKYVAEILNHRKTLEIRKSCPKCELPCEVYIYCTKGKPYLYRGKWFGSYFLENDEKAYGRDYLNGKVVAKFTLNKIVPIVMQHGGLGDMGYGYCAHEDFEWYWNITDKTCVSHDELRKYFNGKDGYAWHIDNLVPFDKPKELKEFFVRDKKGDIPVQVEELKGSKFMALKRIEHAPQSYCYCEVEE